MFFDKMMNAYWNKKAGKKKGFTLIEMLVVIAVIAVLVSIVIPTVSGSTVKAACAVNAANLRSFEGAIQSTWLMNSNAFDNYKDGYIATLSGDTFILNVTDGLITASLDENAGDVVVLDGGNAAVPNLITIPAPFAKKVSRGETTICEDTTTMSIRISSKGVCVATYNGYTAAQFAEMAENPDLIGELPKSDVDQIISNKNDLMNEMQEILNHPALQDPEVQEAFNKILNSGMVDTLEEALDKAIIAVNNSDTPCTECSDCTGFVQGANANTCICTHNSTSHPAKLLESATGVVNGALNGATEWLDENTCPVDENGNSAGLHTWSANGDAGHVCTKCSTSVAHTLGTEVLTAKCTTCGHIVAHTCNLDSNFYCLSCGALDEKAAAQAAQKALCDKAGVHTAWVNKTATQHECGCGYIANHNYIWGTCTCGAKSPCTTSGCTTCTGYDGYYAGIGSYQYEAKKCSCGHSYSGHAH